LLFEQLIDKLIFAPNFFTKYCDDIIFTLEHVLKVASQRIETIVGVFLRLLFHNSHAALTAGVRA
jgi:hypothetical protein